MIRETGEIPSETQILVIGAGIAGHCAALAAAEAGAEVLLIEKSGQAGGSSAIAGGMFAFSGTDLQISAEQPDDLERFRHDILTSGRHQNNVVLVDTFLEHQLDTYHFLQRHGVRFQFSKAVPPAISRSHATGTGRAITALHLALRAHPRITFLSKSGAARLYRSAASGCVDKASVYVGGEEVEIRATAGIVLTTGGFSRSRELLGIFAPELVDAVKHGAVSNTGDGFIMAGDLGAGQADLGYVAGSFGGAIRNYPDHVHDPDEIPPLLFAFLKGGILVNKQGERFADEGLGYKLLSKVGMEQPEGIGFQVFDHKLMDHGGADTSVNNYVEGLVGGYIKTADTIADLARLVGIDAQRLHATVERYNGDIAKGQDAQFGRTAALKPLDTAPFYIAASANAVTSTYGGITVDGDMSVTDWFGCPIEGLFAAGEVVGGFHGAGYYSASSLSSSATFGRLAGLVAARRI